jgi:uncharacterized protein (TIGR02118 family)
MIKLAYPLRRLPRLSQGEFQKYWFEVHAPLVRQHADALAILRYVQLHTLEDPLNDALRASRGAPEPYDGIAELWWRSREELEAAFRSPQGQKASALLLEDEKKFIDLPRSPLWVAQERLILGR